MNNHASNVFINSCTGSGKTLAYLIPILNTLLNDQSQNISLNNTGKTAFSHGALILTLNKQLCLQIYRNIRVLDPQNRLNIKRTGPITHYIPVVTQLKNAGPKTQDDGNYVDYKINQNLVNTVNWSKTDVLISTPHLLWNIMSMASENKNKQPILPKFIAIDQADILIAIDRNVSRFTNKIIEEVKKNVKQAGKKSSIVSNPQFLIAASSFPHKIDKIPFKQALQSKFHPIVEITGQSKHQIPKTIELFFIEMQKMPESKEFYLLDILKSRPNQRSIIFCNTKKTADLLSSLIKEQLKLSPEVYHASLDSNQRSRVLNRFETNISKILISTDLGSRGLDFSLPVHYIVQYEMAENITGWLNRVGRTGRNGVKGEIITMVEKANQQLFVHLEEIVGQGQQLDELFSRKRSYSKLYKQ